MSKAGPNDADATSRELTTTSQEPAPSADDNESNLESIAPVISIDSRQDNIDISQLTERLRHILQCNVCLDVPHPDEINQCIQGHVICDDCVSRIFTEAKLCYQDAYCPHCRVRINWNELNKNTVVRQTLWELPKQCNNCDIMLDFKSLVKHMDDQCEKRIVPCKYSCLGCNWEGQCDKVVLHEKNCPFPKKKGTEILEAILKSDREKRTKLRPISQCYRLFSAHRIYYGNIVFSSNIERSPIFCDCVLTSKKFVAFEQEWYMNLHLNSIEIGSIPHSINYSLTLLALHRNEYSVSFFAMPFSRSMSKQSNDIKMQLQSEMYTPNQLEGEEKPLPIIDTQAICRFLAMPTIKLRLWMFLD